MILSLFMKLQTAEKKFTTKTQLCIYSPDRIHMQYDRNVSLFVNEDSCKYAVNFKIFQFDVWYICMCVLLSRNRGNLN